MKLTASGKVSRVGLETYEEVYSATAAVRVHDKGKRAMVVSWSQEEPVALGAVVHVTVEVDDEVKEVRS